MRHAKAKLKFECPRCGLALEVDSALKGKAVRCPDCSIYIVAPPSQVKEGIALNGFKVEKRLAEGASCEIWLAGQEALDRKVALKILAPVSRDPDFVTRFLEEARMLGRLSHPNIVAAHYAGFDKGVYFLAEDLVEGQDLGQRLKESGKLPEREALEIARKIADALRYAWKKSGMLHRDVKPSNVMIASDGEPRLMDLGISSCMSESGRLDLGDGVTLAGTPAYISPEQARTPDSIDCRADIYSLGATLFHLVTGTLPFEAPLAATLVFKHISAPLPSPRERNPALSRQCSALIKAMMAKSPEERQPGWDEALRDIELVLSGRFPEGATPISRWSQLRKATPSALLLKEGAPRAQALLRRGHALAAGLAAGVFLIPSAWLLLSPQGKPWPAPGASKAEEGQRQIAQVELPASFKHEFDISGILKGKILNFDKETLEIELEYDFANPAQLDDWTPNGANAATEKGALLLEAEGRGDFELKVVFDELSFKSTASFVRNGVGAGMRSRDGASVVFACASFQSAADGYVATDSAGRRTPQKLASAQAKPKQPIALDLSWTGGKSQFAAGGRRWPAVAFEAQGGARLTLAASWAKCQYSGLRISGKLNRDWYEEQARMAARQTLLASKK